MKVNIDRVASAVSSLIFIGANWLRWTKFTDLSAHGRYYFASIIGISGLVAVITLLRMIKKRCRPIEKRPPSEKRKKDQERRRDYRITFAPSEGLVFMEKREQEKVYPAFTCRATDISQTGIGLDCVGVYKTGDTVMGEIIFGSGKTAPINGIVIREDSNGIFIRLHCTLSPSLIMEEQRERIQSEKAMGPLPYSSGSSMVEGDSRLPSHRPKGLCRLKRH